MAIYLLWREVANKKKWTEKFYKILQWTNIVYDSTVEPTWILFDETDIAHWTSWWTSTTAIPSANGKILRTRYWYWGWNGNYTITTFMWYPVCRANNWHWNCYLWTTWDDMQTLLSYSKIKFVIDIIYFWSQPTNYSSWCWWYSYWHITYNYNNSTLNPDFVRTNNMFSFWTPYLYELVYDTATEVSTLTLTNLNTWTSSTASWSSGKPFAVVPTDYQQLVAWWYAVWWINRDQSWWDIYNWNLHIYYQT